MVPIDTARRRQGCRDRTGKPAPLVASNLTHPRAQDPYHDVGQAHGLSFSVLPPTKLPGSLRNIYKQLANDIPDFTPPKTGFVAFFSPPLLISSR